MCNLLHTHFNFRYAVLHALVLRHVYVEVSIAVTFAGGIETAFELCVVVPGMINLLRARPA